MTLFGRTDKVTDSDTGMTDYNAGGQISSVTDPAGSVSSYEYDALTGRMKTETRHGKSPNPDG